MLFWKFSYANFIPRLLKRRASKDFISGEGRPINRYPVDCLCCSFFPFLNFRFLQNNVCIFPSYEPWPQPQPQPHDTTFCSVVFLVVNFRRTLIKDVEIEFLATTKNEPSKNERLNKNAKWKWWQIRCTSLNMLNWKILRFSIHKPFTNSAAGIGNHLFSLLSFLLPNFLVCVFFFFKNFHLAIKFPLAFTTELTGKCPNSMMQK